MSTHELTAGAVGSPNELAMYMSTVVCPGCGHEGITAWKHDDRDGVVIGYGRCPICSAYTNVAFQRAPEWGRIPTDNLHLTVSDQPSGVLPEAYFRSEAASAIRRLGNADRNSRGSVVPRAERVVLLLLEIRKFRLAEGRDLDAEDREQLQAALHELMSRGEALPGDIAVLAGDR